MTVSDVILRLGPDQVLQASAGHLRPRGGVTKNVKHAGASLGSDPQPRREEVWSDEFWQDPLQNVNPGGKHGPLLLCWQGAEPQTRPGSGSDHSGEIKY